MEGGYVSQTRAAMVLGHIGWVFTVVGCLSCSSLEELILDSQKPSPREAAKQRKKRLAPVTEIAPAPLPEALPLLGEPGVTANGYPTQYVDKAALRSLLWHEKYAELTEYMEAFQDAFEKNPRYEHWPIHAAGAFETSEKSLRPKYNAWIAATPDSFAPYLARGGHFVATGYASRGAKEAYKTAKSDFATMEQAMARAVSDLDTAVQKRPNLNAAHQLKIQALLPTKKNAELLQVIDAAAKTCPECLQVRITSMYALRPRWGGSYEQMKALADAADRTKNPAFRLLEGIISIDKADRQKRDDPAGALAEIEKAVALGELWEFLLKRAEIHEAAKSYAAALADLNRVLALRPQCARCLLTRAGILYKQKKYEAAARDYLAGVRIDPTDLDAQHLYHSIISGLLYQGWEEFKAGRQVDAIRIYDLAADLAPNNREVQGRKVSVITGGEKPKPSDIPKYEAQVAKSPDDLTARRQLDYSIAYTTRQFDRIVASWNDYLSRHPDDGRALIERGGAYFHLGKRAEAKQDVKRACELGFSEGCGLMKRLK